MYKNAGQKFHLLLLRMINCIKQSHEFAEQWENMKITCLYKAKGSRKQLVNQRGIFLTQVITKIFERLVKQRTKCVTTKINKLQAGSRTDKSTADQNFLLRSCIVHAKYLNIPLYLNFYDFRLCFDKIWLEDSIISLYKLGLQNEFLALIYKINLKANIIVNTPLGCSKPFTKRSIVKQGSVTASTLCSASTGEFCSELIIGGIIIGNMIINSLAYVDDLTTANTEATDAVATNTEVCFFADKKKQPLNEEKCYLLPINLKMSDPIPTQLVNEKPITIKDEVGYLGDIYNKHGNYNDLVSDRVRKGTVCTINSMALCNDSEMGCYAIHSLLLLYKAVLIQTLIFNSETWVGLPTKMVEKLEVSQMKFLKWMLHAPKGTSNSFTLLELGILPIRDEIKIRKLTFLHHILNLEDDDPVKSNYREQEKFPHEPNWRNEISQSLIELNINTSEENIKNMSKNSWKRIVKQTVIKKALVNLHTDCTRLKKTSNVPPYQNLVKQDYMDNLSPTKARTFFQLKAGTFDVKSNRTYQYEDTICRLCQNDDETVDHVVNQCNQVNRVSSIDTNNIHNLAGEDILEMVKRVLSFQELIDSKDV